jgi:hypothetical protein
MWFFEAAPFLDGSTRPIGKDIVPERAHLPGNQVSGSSVACR